METEELTINEHCSSSPSNRPLILSVTTIDSDKPRTVEFVVGQIGLPSLTRTLRVGGAVLFETSEDGLFEIRILSITKRMSGGVWCDCATFGVSQLLARHAPTGGVPNESTANHPFTSSEVERIRTSLEPVHDAIRQRGDITPEQVDYISRKLDEIVDAASRVGRKDWVNIAIGTLTNVVVGAAVGSDAAKFLFQTMGQALSWLLGQTLKLLP
ncbi:MAG: hypothetical protein AABO41_09715 [Acidobacteriota bacterium]